LAPLIDIVVGFTTQRGEFKLTSLLDLTFYYKIKYS